MSKISRFAFLVAGAGAFVSLMVRRSESHSMWLRAIYAGLAFVLLAAAIVMFRRAGRDHSP